MTRRQSVVDASVLVAALVDSGADGDRARAALGGPDQHAPHLLPFEVGAVLRRAELRGDLTARATARAHLRLGQAPIRLWPAETVAARAWELRPTVTYHDATYVALAELLDATLLTLDRRLAAAPGVRCEVDTLLRPE
ncbi:type II toxin-antitoxin system ribonuclease VapC1 [Pseudonocardia ailaonensis]|uniref:Ribonuclease VapC n=1 Tax=Pseudonocardia ailaonensis TaxID=367279 RepID=A0ABN2N1P6_9PSEU